MAGERHHRSGAAALKRPPGLLGWLAGQGMLHGRSHRACARWAIGLLAPGTEDDVLEVGCGPGYALGLITRMSRGRIVGIDPSRLMIGLAGRHLRRLHSDARTTLICASAEDLPSFDVAFERVLAIDAWPFGTEPAQVLGLLHERLAPGGRIALAARPRAPHRAATSLQSLALEMGRALEAAGFGQIESHFNRDIGLRPGVCVTAHRAKLGG